MATRKIKNAKDLVTDELIYFKSHAQATFMSDGTTVEDKINNLQAGGADLTEYAKKSELASVATSGSYNDLSNKPTIPSAVTESTVSGWGFTKNTGTYSKPSGGIPKSDLASAVQTSLGKADTALQSYTEQYKGTVTGVKINGTTKNPTSGVVDLGTVITSHQDISGKQDKLVSGTNIKTINGISILGSGDITISGGSGGSSSGSGAYPQINHDNSDPIVTITPNTFHVWDEIGTLDVSLGAETTGVANEYIFQFTSGSEPTSLILPDDIKWANDNTPTISENMIYQISILNGLATYLEFDNSNTQIPIFYIDGTEYQMDEGMTWEEWVNSEYNIVGFYIDYMPWTDTYCIAIGEDMGYGTVVGGDIVSKSDLISSGYEYTIYYENGGGPI